MIASPHHAAQHATLRDCARACISSGAAKDTGYLLRPCAYAGVASSLGACLLSLFAWLLHSWRLLTFVTSAILALAVSLIVPVLQESPRWLLNIGRKVMLRLLYLPSDDEDVTAQG